MLMCLSDLALGGTHMDKRTPEIARRTAVALAAIKRAMDSDGGESSVALFVSHHLEEIEESFWREHAGTPRPSAERVLDLLVLRKHWREEDEDGIDTFDFSLPDYATDYVLAVRFGDDGEVEDISMES
jgi:hypothetical protein